MDITPLKEVSAGQPVTAQAWNAIVQAINTVVDYLKSTEATSVTPASSSPRTIICAPLTRSP